MDVRRASVLHPCQYKTSEKWGRVSHVCKFGADSPTSSLTGLVLLLLAWILDGLCSVNHEWFTIASVLLCPEDTGPPHPLECTVFEDSF